MKHGCFIAVVLVLIMAFFNGCHNEPLDVRAERDLVRKKTHLLEQGEMLKSVGVQVKNANAKLVKKGEIPTGIITFILNNTEDGKIVASSNFQVVFAYEDNVWLLKRIDRELTIAGGPKTGWEDKTDDKDCRKMMSQLFGLGVM